MPPFRCEDPSGPGGPGSCFPELCGGSVGPELRCPSTHTVAGCPPPPAWGAEPPSLGLTMDWVSVGTLQNSLRSLLSRCSCDHPAFSGDTEAQRGWGLSSKQTPWRIKPCGHPTSHFAGRKWEPGAEDVCTAGRGVWRPVEGSEPVLALGATWLPSVLQGLAAGEGEGMAG